MKFMAMHSCTQRSTRSHGFALCPAGYLWSYLPNPGVLLLLDGSAAVGSSMAVGEMLD